MILFSEIEFPLPITLKHFMIVICIKTIVEGEFLNEPVFTLRLLFRSFL